MFRALFRFGVSIALRAAAFEVSVRKRRRKSEPAPVVNLASTEMRHVLRAVSTLSEDARHKAIEVEDAEAAAALRKAWHVCRPPPDSF